VREREREREREMFCDWVAVIATPWTPTVAGAEESATATKFCTRPFGQHTTMVAYSVSTESLQRVSLGSSREVRPTEAEHDQRSELSRNRKSNVVPGMQLKGQCPTM
jgi:hypothetical protein